MDIRAIGKVVVVVVCLGIISFGFSTLRPGQWEEAIKTIAATIFWGGLVWGTYKGGMHLVEGAARRAESRSDSRE